MNKHIENLKLIGKMSAAFIRDAWQIGSGRTPRGVMHQPIGPMDLGPVPDGWRITGPHFVGVGAPKCGTSWWYHLILSHPQVVKNRLAFSWDDNKELFYLPHFQHNGLTEQNSALYREFFAAPPGSICGEFTTYYMAHPLCIRRLADAAPETRIVAILRNPIDRTFSHLNQLIKERMPRYFSALGPARQYLLKTYSFTSEAYLHSLYSIGLDHILASFDSSRILILQYERCVSSPYEEIARTYRFLGIDDNYTPDSIERRRNRIPYVIDKPTARERVQLAEYFSPDVLRLCGLRPDINLDLWTDFSHLSTSKNSGALS